MLENGDWDWYSETTAPRRNTSRHLFGLWQERRGTGGGLGGNPGEHQQPSERDPLDDAPADPGGFVRLRWGRYLLLVGLVGAGVAELAIIWVAYELVDLSISLMEVWTQLARKHLEITL